MCPTSEHGAADVALLTFACVCVMLAGDAVSVADRSGCAATLGADPLARMKIIGVGFPHVQEERFC